MKFLKLLTLSVLCISSVSCTPKFSSKVYYTDYQRYSDAGFFITESNTVSFDYVPVGSVVVRQTAGIMSDTEIISQNVPENGDMMSYTENSKRSGIQILGNFQVITQR